MKQQINYQALEMILRPIVRFCLKSNYNLNDIINVAKVIFVRLAQEELSQQDERVNVSRLSVMTGVHRKDVTRIYKQNSVPVRQLPNAAGRVMATWEQNREFCKKDGKPRMLKYEGDNSEFHRLVRMTSSDLSPLALLNELERRQLAKRDGNKVKFLAALVPSEGEQNEAYALLSEDINDLIQAVSANVSGVEQIKHLHIRTEYDNIAANKLPEIRRWILKRGQEFHKQMRAYLSQFDRDISNDTDKSTERAKVMVGAFSFAQSEVKTTNEAT